MEKTKNNTNENNEITNKNRIKGSIAAALAVVGMTAGGVNLKNEFEKDSEALKTIELSINEIKSKRSENQIYQDIWKKMNEKNIKVTTKQIEELINEFNKIEGQDISNQEKVNLLRKYCLSTGVPLESQVEIINLYVDMKKQDELDEKKNKSNPVDRFRKNQQTITDIFNNKKLSNSGIKKELKSKLKYVLEDDFIDNVMENKDLDLSEKESKIKSKVLEDYEETLLDKNLYMDMRYINIEMKEDSSNQAKIDELSKKLKYCHYEQIEAIINNGKLTKEQKITGLKDCSKLGYKLDNLKGKTKEAYDIFINIMNDNNNTNKKASLENNLKQFGLAEVVSDIYGESKTQGEIKAKLAKEILKMDDRKGYEDLYVAMNRVVRQDNSKNDLKSRLKDELCKISDMKAIINIGDLNVDTLEKIVKQGELNKVSKYETVNYLFEELKLARDVRKIEVNNPELKTIIEDNLGKATGNTLKNKMNEKYPVKDMEMLGILPQGKIESIMADTRLTKRQKTLVLMYGVVTCKERYDELGLKYTKENQTNIQR